MSEAFFSPETQKLLQNDDFLEDRSGFDSKISEQISQLHREVRTLEICRNELPFPNRLPPELLSRIFLIHSHDQKSGTSHTYNLRSSRKAVHWICVSHVCTYWRSVALNCPFLWAELNFFHPELTELMLERSMNTPLYVKFEKDIRMTRANDQLPIALSHCKRLKYVEVTSRFTDHLPFPTLLDALGHDAPVLQTLILASTPSSNIDSPKVFTLGGAPALKHLELAKFNFRWDNIPLGRSLTNLYLDPHTYPTVPTRPKWDTFLLPFVQMPLLQNLEMHDILPLEGYPKLKCSRLSLPITLRNLKQSTIEDTTLGLGTFFQFFEMPQSSALNLLFSDHVELVGASIEQCILSIKGAWVDNAELPEKRGPLQTIDINYTTPPGYAAGFRFDAKSPLLNPVNSEGSDQALSLTFRSMDPDILLRPFLSSLTKHLDFSQLEEVDLDGAIVPAALVQTTIANRPVKKLSLHDAAFDELEELLSSGFMNLETIALDRVDFGSGAKANVQLLIALLKSREPNIRRLEILEASNFCEHDSNQVQIALPMLDFAWDGYKAQLCI